MKKKTEKAQAVTAQMAPMMADVEKIMAKCGEDEDCITRETQKMGEALRGTPQMATAMNAKKDAQELAGRTDNNRVVNFRGTPDMIGRFVEVKITESDTHDLWAEVVRD